MKTLQTPFAVLRTAIPLLGELRFRAYYQLLDKEVLAQQFEKEPSELRPTAYAMLASRGAGILQLATRALYSMGLAVATLVFGVATVGARFRVAVLASSSVADKLLHTSEGKAFGLAVSGYAAV